MNLLQPYPELKYKYRNREFWCRGYYVDIAGKNAKKIEEYIKHQALPNREISLVYRKEILQKFENMIPQSTAIAVQGAIFSGDGTKLRDIIRKLLIQSVSSFDTAKKNFYHGFMLGICALLGGSYITSNRESGEGRYDIQLSPETKTLSGIIIELKVEHYSFYDEAERISAP